MFNFLRKNTIPLLTVLLNDNEICQISKAEVPCEKKISAPLPTALGELIFQDYMGKRYIHSLSYEKGWIHLSVRVHLNFACQIDCLISDEKQFDEGDFAKGKIEGIRFQPFLISYTKVNKSPIPGKGLFERGLHFTGTITPGNVSLSCICDKCEKSFRIKSFHAGFSTSEYFYSESGLQTLMVNENIEGIPSAIDDLDFKKLTLLESKFPLAKDGTKFKYLNPFRCPHCKSPYIDFQRHPKQRQSEYYGNYFYGDEIAKFESEKQAGG